MKNYILRIKDRSQNSGDRSFLKELAEIMNSRGSLGLRLEVYGGVSELNKYNLDLAQRLGVNSILVGVESGNTEIRRLNGKYFPHERIFTTANECRKRNIQYNPAFVLGMIGETDETAMQTVDVARKLVSQGFCNKVYASLFMPFPGSPAYDLIREKLNLDPTSNITHKGQFNRWDYDWSRLIDAQVEILTSTTREHLCSCLDQMKDLNNKARLVMGDYSVSKEASG